MGGRSAQLDGVCVVDMVEVPGLACPDLLAAAGAVEHACVDVWGEASA